MRCCEHQPVTIQVQNTIILLLWLYSEAEIAEMDLAAVAAEIDLEADQKEEESS